MKEKDLSDIFEQNQRDAEEIERIKKSDPTGWQEMELVAAKEYVVDYLSSQAVNKQSGQQERLAQYREQFKAVRPQLENIHSLQELQKFMETRSMAEIPGFEQLVYEFYRERH